jgi:sortase B
MKNIKSFILPLSFICFFMSSAFILLNLSDSLQDKREQQELISKKESVTDTDSSVSLEPEDPQILVQYQSLHQENSDMIGWVKIEGTSLDYPVMQNREDGEYYLHRNFQKEYEYSGLPFLDKKCNISNSDTNRIIYGHNMKNDSMFSCLLKYRDQEYFTKHPMIEFDTIYEQGRYQIIAVILSKVYKKTDDTFKFYQFVRADTEKEFDEYIRNMKELSLYDTGISAIYGDELLTLVTCAYHTENGRLAVLAKKVN